MQFQSEGVGVSTADPMNRSGAQLPAFPNYFSFRPFLFQDEEDLSTQHISE